MDFIFATRYKSGGVDSRHVGTFNLYILGIREIAIVSEIPRMGKNIFPERTCKHACTYINIEPIWQAFYID